MNLGKLIQYYYVTSAIVKWIKSSEKYVFLQEVFNTYRHARQHDTIACTYSEQTEQLDRE